mmetsp:Transcript_96858/g.202379  ORF Transcript_96858/g.202379 Transcript_96858/m.202379 type:complete len:219 (-) Transcript_96858:425-1081(-)
MLLLLAEGKCVSYVMVRADACRLGRLLAPFVATCLLLELWGEQSARQRYNTDFVYTTCFGWLLICADMALFAQYARNILKTYARERESHDADFYRRWGPLCGCWFLTLPLTAILSQLVLAPYAWWFASFAVHSAGTVGVYAALVVGLWPGNCKSFLKLRMPMLNEEELESGVQSRRFWGSLPMYSPSKDSCPIRLPSLLESRGYGRGMKQPKMARQVG